MRQILSEHEQQASQKTMSSYVVPLAPPPSGRPLSPLPTNSTTTTLPAANHRLPRPYLVTRDSGSDLDRNSPQPRSILSNYSPEGDHHNNHHQQLDTDNSILVSKVPTTSRHHVSTNSTSSGKRVTITTTTGYNQDSNLESSMLTSSHGNNVAELEKHLRRMNPSSLVSVCLDLAEQVKRLERQAELREELLRRNQRHLESKDRALREKDGLIRRLEKHADRIDEEDEDEDANNNALLTTADILDSLQSVSDSSAGGVSSNRCRFSNAGCPFRLPSMEEHEERECRYRPTRCPSLTCPVKPAFANLLKHIQDEHDGSRKGRDRVCCNDSHHLISSYVNIDKEPVFYKTSRMTWVANELVLEGSHHFFLECMRLPPDWHLWLYYLGGEKDAEKFQATITLFREEEYGRLADTSSFTAQRSYTGPVISIHRSKEEIAEYGLGFMVHDKQVRPLCGTITNQEEQLFGYEVTVYRK